MAEPDLLECVSLLGSIAERLRDTNSSCARLDFSSGAASLLDVQPHCQLLPLAHVEAALARFNSQNTVVFRSLVQRAAERVEALREGTSCSVGVAVLLITSVCQEMPS
jgi:hypothetical protein